MKTDSEIKNDTAWLGDVEKIERVNDYTFVTFKRRDNLELEYRGYYLNDHFSRSYESLDLAIASTIALRHDGRNSQAGNYFIKMLDIQTNS